MKYDVVRGFVLEDLVAEVNKKIKEGWVLKGGISCSISESDEYSYSEYVQAIVKEEL